MKPKDFEYINCIVGENTVEPEPQNGEDLPFVDIISDSPDGIRKADVLNKLAQVGLLGDQQEPDARLPALELISSDKSRLTFKDNNAPR